MNNYKYLDVFYEGEKVGTLAKTNQYTAAFEYADEWLQQGFSVSPLSLPLEKRVFIPNYDPFRGLYGVFSDSLPDGWGRLLVDRFLARNGENPASLDGADIGRQEYEYSLCAKACGIEMTETRLFSSKKCDGYFRTKRFDRDGKVRKHMISVQKVCPTCACTKVGRIVGVRSTKQSAGIILHYNHIFTQFVWSAKSPSASVKTWR